MISYFPYTTPMSPNPFYNALAAIAYIVILVSFMFFGPLQGPDTADNASIFKPMLALSLLVLSVAVMAFLFFYQPITLLLDNKREQAVKFFLQTLGTFAVGTALLAILSVLVVNG